MGCCPHVVRNQQEIFEQMPDSTFMCMARMTYQLARTAETFYTGRERAAWETLSDEQCEAYAADVRRMVRGYPPPPGEQHTALSFHMLHSLITNV
jgi:galactose-1-phosphate uridylyltransferase